MKEGEAVARPRFGCVYLNTNATAGSPANFAAPTDPPSQKYGHATGPEVIRLVYPMRSIHDFD